MSDEGLDNLFKQGLSGRDVKFNMDSWRRMEEMLPPEPKAKGFRFGYVAAFIGVLLVLSTSLFVWNTGKEEAILLNSEKIERNINSKNTGVVSHENDQISVKTNSSNNLSEEVFVKGGSNSEDKKPDNRSAQYSNTSMTSMKAAQQITSGSVNSKKSDMNATSNKTNSFFAKSDNSSTGFFNSVTHSNVNTKRGDSDYAEETISFSKNAFTQIEGVGELAFVGFEDQSTKTLVADVSEGRLPKVSKNVVGFIGGFNINQSLVDAPQNGISGSEFFGLEYQRYLNGGFSLKTNLLYSARSGVNSQKTYAKKYYDFGSSSSQSTVEAQRMVYFEMPVLLNYGVANHNFMVGPSFSYLVSSLNKVTTVYESTTENIPTLEEAVWGYTDGFKKYDFAIVAGYEYSLKPQLNLGVRLNYGLVDITDNNYFNDDSFDNNVQFRVYVTYSPFQF